MTGHINHVNRVLVFRIQYRAVYIYVTKIVSNDIPVGRSPTEQNHQNLVIASFEFMICSGCPILGFIGLQYALRVVFKRLIG